jgi:3D (Asp-Asp-Asp) domain-containing protein
MTNLFFAVVTAYCADKICCGSSAKGITAMGKKPIQGITIAGPRHIKLGTKVIINNHLYIVQDRTAVRYNGRWDIFFKKHSDAIKFGRKQLTIRIEK